METSHTLLVVGALEKDEETQNVRGWSLNVKKSSLRKDIKEKKVTQL